MQASVQKRNLRQILNDIQSIQVAPATESGIRVRSSDEPSILGESIRATGNPCGEVPLNHQGTSNLQSSGSLSSALDDLNQRVTRNEEALRARPAEQQRNSRLIGARNPTDTSSRRIALEILREIPRDLDPDVQYYMTKEEDIISSLDISQLRNIRNTDQLIEFVGSNNRHLLWALPAGFVRASRDNLYLKYTPTVLPAYHDDEGALFFDLGHPIYGKFDLVNGQFNFMTENWGSNTNNYSFLPNVRAGSSICQPHNGNPIESLLQGTHTNDYIGRLGPYSSSYAARNDYDDLDYGRLIEDMFISTDMNSSSIIGELGPWRSRINSNCVSQLRNQTVRVHRVTL
jgi:hypothetical protein